jgi:PPIC-type PPIASE domain
MRKSWLLCVLMGTLAWGQNPQSAPPAEHEGPVPGMMERQEPPAAPDTASVPATAAVITIDGVCAARPKPAAAKTATAGKAAATPASECKTVVTKEEFETLLKGVTPNPSPQIRQQLANVLPRIIAMSSQARQEGLDKTPQFEAMIKFAKMQILSTELQRNIQEKAAKITDAEIEDYYKNNSAAFEQFNLERLFVPRTKQIAADTAENAAKDENLTEDQKKAKEAADKAKQEEAELAMTKLADDLRARAAAGESFQALQKEAFAAAGMKIESPTVEVPGVRRTGLQAAHAAVFDLKPGDVSQVINDAGGHYIYKLVSKSEIALAQAQQEIRNTLQNQRMREMMEKATNSYKPVLNPAYFGAGAAATPPMPRLPNRLPQVRPGTQSHTPAAGQPGEQAPAAKPN